MVKKIIAGLQWLDTQINAPGFRAGAIVGVAASAMVAAVLAAIWR